MPLERAVVDSEPLYGLECTDVEEVEDGVFVCFFQPPARPVEVMIPPWAPGVIWRCYDNGEGYALVGEFPDGTGIRHYVENVNPRAAWDFLAAESAVMVERWLG